MDGAGKSISEVFWEELRSDWQVESIINALQRVDKLLKKSIGEVTEEKEISCFFFKIDAMGWLEGNPNYQELMEFWDNFILFEEITREKRWNYFSGEPFIIQTIFRVFILEKCSQIQYYYKGWNQEEQKEAHILLTQVFERKEPRMLCMVELLEGKVSITERYYLTEESKYENLEDLMGEKDIERLEIIVGIFQRFIKMGIIIITIKIAKKVKNEGIWLLYKKRVKIPKDVLEQLLENMY